MEKTKSGPHAWTTCARQVRLMSISDPLQNPSQPMALGLVQRRRKRFAAALIALFAVAGAMVRPPDASWADLVAAAGMAVTVAAIVGRAWCSLYIGGRKAAELVTQGPYSVCRNPLYVFSILGALGVAAQTGSVVMAGLGAAATVIVLWRTVAREEDWLGAHMGSAYAAYLRDVPRFLPAFRLWREPEELLIRPVLFRITLRHGLAFLGAGLMQRALGALGSALARPGLVLP